MIYALLSLIVILVGMVAFLLIQNAKLKQAHLQSIHKLEAIISSLHSKQRLLNEKVLISAEYNDNYRRDMKALGDEVFELQKVFVDIISNKNYN